jgi:hypothetical protein
MYTGATAIDHVNCHHDLHMAIANPASAAPLLSQLMESEGGELQEGSASGRILCLLC